MYSILVDVTKCTGCERCVAACIEANGTNAAKAEVDRAVAVDGLSADRLVSLVKVDGRRFARKSCMHCLEPACASACLVGGIAKTPEGPVVYDAAKCIGCRYCMLACPFHIPRYQWEKSIPYMKKCVLCFDRLREGHVPACVDACPNGALKFGQREELLSEAHDRIRSRPDLYRKRVWGEHEFGGTSVLYISDVDLGPLGWPAPETESIPSVTEPLIAMTPIIGLTVAGGLLGTNWIIRRRMKLQQEKDTHSTED